MHSTANLYNSSSTMDIAEGPTDDLNKTPEKRKNFIVRALLWHYGNTACNVTPEQFEKEKYVIGKLKFNPIVLMPAAIIIQFCCGSLYVSVTAIFIEYANKITATSIRRLGLFSTHQSMRP